MLFNSYEFILLFLPIVLLVFYSIGNTGSHQLAMLWLVLTSLFFYGWWNPSYLLLIIASMTANYAIGIPLGDEKRAHTLRRSLLILGITANLGLLGYYKYANFFIENYNVLTDSELFLGTIALPLAISFFTFQQITYLVDAYRGEMKEYSFLHYSLFVTFFPQLIAGPIVHHKEMMPQFDKSTLYRFRYSDFSIGATIFIIGLFKKVMIADELAQYATPVFDSAAAGEIPSLVYAWQGALAYTFQLYFDFSGYSDMAIGAARMFGIRIPLNFNSPYKATNIIDFWRRWHMTLSRFLRDYVYFSLGGNKKGNTRRYINLMVTMLLGGLWHGAGWTFVVWGGLHGAYLAINHGWHAVCRGLGLDLGAYSSYRIAAKFLTFIAVVIGWVIFRAVDMDSALLILGSMFDFLSVSTLTEKDARVFLAAFLLLLLVWYSPNSQQLVGEGDESDAQQGRLRFYHWRPNLIWGVLVATLGLYTLLHMSRISEFLYFQF